MFDVVCDASSQLLYLEGVTHLSDLTAGSHPLLPVRPLQDAAPGGRKHQRPLVPVDGATS